MGKQTKNRLKNPSQKGKSHTRARNSSPDKADPKAILEKIRLNAAGVDIGSAEIFVALSDPQQPVQKFSTFTQGIQQALAYIKSHGAHSIAMEATGIYWWPIYEVFESGGLEVYIVNACHAKNVPGRKTDVLDAEWLRELHTYGLVRSSFVPDEMIRKLRVYMRQRSDDIDMGASHIQHMQKHLDAMNIKLHTVISNLTGVSGLRVIRAILSGERDPAKLALLCKENIEEEKIEAIQLSLEGHYKEEHLFGLQQALTGWEFYQSRLKECDGQIEKLLRTITKDKPVPNNIKKPKIITNFNQPEIEGLHTLLVTFTGGRDASQLPGFNDYSLMRVISETGIDMSPWPTEKHFTSWLNLAPWNNSSGKKKRNRIRKIENRAGQMFREMARSVGNSKYQALGSFYRRIKSRLGAKAANKATARKIAVLFYRLMKYGFNYVEQGLEDYEKKYKEKALKNLIKKAHQFGMNLVPQSA